MATTKSKTGTKTPHQGPRNPRKANGKTTTAKMAKAAVDTPLSAHTMRTMKAALKAYQTSPPIDITKNNLTKQLKGAARHITFIKADGSVRNMRASLTEQDCATPPVQPKMSTHITVFDTVASDWRTLRLDSIKDIVLA